MGPKRTGVVLDIHRSSLHDGPGIRTTVFLKGCPLRCRWCHNPESFCKEPQLSFSKGKCTQCKLCAHICPKGVHDFSAGNHKVWFDKCNLCGKCIQACPNCALIKMGQEMSVEEVLNLVIADKDFYKSTGGGMTISGGEPLQQIEYIKEILKKCKTEGIHTCVETCGNVDFGKFMQVIEVTDLFLYDFKASNVQMQKEYTGGSYELILENLIKLCKNNKTVWLRCPIVPGIQDTKEHFAKIAELGNRYPQIQKVQLMPYHSYGKDKWEQLGMEYELKSLETVSKEQKAEWMKQMAWLNK